MVYICGNQCADCVQMCSGAAFRRPRVVNITQLHHLPAAGLEMGCEPIFTQPISSGIPSETISARQPLQLSLRSSSELISSDGLHHTTIFTLNKLKLMVKADTKDVPMRPHGITHELAWSYETHIFQPVVTDSSGSSV